VAAALARAGAPLGAVAIDAAALDVLRVEAGHPRAGAEIGPDTLPAELRLEERAISFSKGCYTGQEIVARMASRGRVGHLLVGLAFDAVAPPAAGSALRAGVARVGEITSVARSPRAGAIALGIVRKGFDAPGSVLDADGVSARVVALPFVTP
jgi:folate-binding protein YgfZ